MVILSYASGGPLDNFKMGVGHRRGQSHGQRVRTVGQPSTHGGEGRGMERSAVASGLPHPARIGKPQGKTPGTTAQQSFPVGEAGKAPGFHEERSWTLSTSSHATPDLDLCISFIWLFPSCNLYTYT